MAKPRTSDYARSITFLGGIEKRLHTRIIVVGLDEVSREVGLRIEIDGETFVFTFLADTGKQPTSVRLPDATFQIQDGNDLGTGHDNRRIARLIA